MYEINLSFPVRSGRRWTENISKVLKTEENILAEKVFDTKKIRFPYCPSRTYLLDAATENALL